MLGFTTEIDLKRHEVRTTFGKTVRTFAFDDDKFLLVEALKVAAEDINNQVLQLLQAMLDHVERIKREDLEFARLRSEMESSGSSNDNQYR